MDDGSRNAVLLISIGNELLTGQTINTNAAWLGEQLNMAGYELMRSIVIRDTREDIVEAIELSKDYDISIFTGGLGPTSDDITKQVIADFLKVELVIHEASLENVTALFRRFGRSLTERNRRQALIPEGIDVLPNSAGTAPGLSFKIDDSRLFFLPGVPMEMKRLFSKSILDIISKEYPPGIILHRIIQTQGLGESHLSDQLKEWEEGLPDELSLAYLPSPGIVKLRLTARGINREHLESVLDEQSSQLYKLIPQLIFGEGDITLQEVVGTMLRQKGLSISSAESCTGGNVAHLITSVPGSSDYFKGSVVAYENDVKSSLLGVDERMIEEHGAVSELVVKAMADGVRKATGSDFGIASSGIAGPGGGSVDKPVGLTWLAVSGPGGTSAMRFRFGSNRERNITWASLTLLNMLRRELEGNHYQFV